MKIMFINITMVIFLSGCLDFGIRGTPKSRVRSNFVMECLIHFEKKNNFDTNKQKCETLGSCIRKITYNTKLTTYEPWPIIEKLIPYTFDGHYVPIDYMRTTAKTLGLPAQTMFNLLHGIRQQCMMEAGIDHELVKSTKINH